MYLQTNHSGREAIGTGISGDEFDTGEVYRSDASEQVVDGLDVGCVFC